MTRMTNIVNLIIAIIVALMYSFGVYIVAEKDLVLALTMGYFSITLILCLIYLKIKDK